MQRTIIVEVPVYNAAVISGPDPLQVLDYLSSLSSGAQTMNDNGIFEFQLLFPSKYCGGSGDSPQIVTAKIFIDGNSIVSSRNSRFSGALCSLDFREYESSHGPIVRINYLTGQEGGERVGEIVFEIPIDKLIPENIYAHA